MKGNDVKVEREIVLVVSWVKKVHADVLETEVAVALVGVSKASTVAINAYTTYTTPALASVGTSTGVEVGKGGEDPVTL